MHTPDHWYPPPSDVKSSARLKALALAPLGALYNLGGKLRFLLAQPLDAKVPVICIGNLTAGGTGKTPLTIAIAHALSVIGHRPHILTRGYRGKMEGPMRVDPARHNAQIVGDEALLLAAAAPTWIARDRRSGARAAIDAGAELLLMDDGFQNPSLKKSLSLVVVDGEVGFGNGRVIPAGPLRESIGRGFARADALVLMGRPSEHTLQQIARWNGPVFHAELKPPPNALVPGRYIAFAGIGRPENFFRTLERLGAELVERAAFSDHHAYSDAELARLANRAETMGAKLITTEKDAVRLPDAMRARVAVLPVAASIGAREAFGSFLMERLASCRQMRRNAQLDRAE